MPKQSITRRTFAKTLAAAAAASALPLHAASKLNVGVGTYSYHNLTLDQMIVQLNALEVGEIEMSRGEFMLMNKPTLDMFKTARAKLDQAKIRCVSYYTATIKEDVDLDHAVRFAKILGAANITGDATGPILNSIDERLTQENLTFGIHNHYFKGEKFAYESPDDVLNALANLSPTVGATADVGHFVSCGHDPVKALRQLAPRLKLVHLKDIQAAGDDVNVLLGQGIAKIPAVMQELHRQNFAGFIAVEYEKEGDVNTDMGKDMDFARALA
jgi:sugar phosphate isomerase/epimerase